MINKAVNNNCVIAGALGLLGVGAILIIGGHFGHQVAVVGAGSGCIVTSAAFFALKGYRTFKSIQEGKELRDDASAAKPIPQIGYGTLYEPTKQKTSQSFQEWQTQAPWLARLIVGK